MRVRRGIFRTAAGAGLVTALVLLIAPAAQAVPLDVTPAGEQVIGTYPDYQTCRYEGEEMTLSGEIPDSWYCAENSSGTVDLILVTD